MKRERIVEFVGGSEEDVAFLRLLLRKAAKQLLDGWRLRREGDSHIDLLIVEDLGEPGAPMPPPARDGSPRRVRLIDPAFGAAGMETVVWPLSQEALIGLFNQSRSKATAPQPVTVPVIAHNIYDDLFEPDQPDRWAGGDDIATQMLDFTGEWIAPPRAQESALMHEAEQFFRNDPRTQHKDALKAMRLHADVDVEATDGHTLGTGSRKDRRGSIGLAADSSNALKVDEASACHPLATYLNGRLLSGPARIEAGELVLTLDPRNRLYFAKGALCVFEDCCKQALRRGDWHSLSFSEFAEVKKHTDGRPYAELQWLCAYLDQSATEELDTVLRYRLTQSIDLQRDYPGAARVAHELVQGANLTSAATAARVSLAEANRVAAAFDALGYLVPE